MYFEYHEMIATQKWNMPARLFYGDLHDGYRAHWHGQSEFLFVERGDLEAVISKEPVSAQTGDFLIINENEVHRIAPTDADVLCLHIQENFLKAMMIPEMRFRHILKGDKTVRSLFSDMRMRMDSDDRRSDFLTMSRIYELLAHLIASPVAYRISQREQELSANRDKAFKTAIAHIEAHYADELTTDKLAQSVFLTEAYFCRYFKRRTGESPTRYINRFRVKMAMPLLENTEKSMTEVALAVGFSDSNYFARVFRSFMDISPAEYRRAHISGNGQGGTLT